MRFVWTDAGDDPSWDVGDRHEISGYFWPMFDSLTTRENLLDTQKRGYVAGVYLAWNWAMFAGRTPQEIATIASVEYKRLNVPQLRVQFNDERHEPEAIIQELEEFRVLHPNVGLSWTPEGMQGGWFGPIVVPPAVPSAKGFVGRLLAARVRVVPQGYWGAGGQIEGAWAEDQVLRDLTRRGLPESVVSIFYDAAALPRGWDGYAFTMGRLP